MLMKAKPARSMFDALPVTLADETQVKVDDKVYPVEQFVQLVDEEQIEQPAEHAVQFGTFVINEPHWAQKPVAL